MKETIGIIIMCIAAAMVGFLVVQMMDIKPNRWYDVNIQQVNAAGEVVQTWEHAEVMTTCGMFGPNCVRFKTQEGNQVTLSAMPYRFIYNDKE